jgi:hypothetical protein
MRTIGLAVLLFLCVPAWGWELVKEEDGIRVYTRKIEHSPIAESLGVITVDAPFSAVAALLMDADRQQEWIDSVDESRLLQRVSDREIYLYTVSRAPWPVADRDAVVYSELSQDRAGIVVIRSHATPDFQPPVEGLLRIREVDSTWKLIPRAGRKVELCYRVHSDPGGQLPAWLINSAVVNQPYNTLRNLRERVQQPPYRDAAFPPIHEPSAPVDGQESNCLQ